ncbi:SDR family oxidoreductase [Aquibacillus halophilus]|uniref:SDR family oxidoreductase n=1 Tax=Aquibacillus halophilus TaxID=930132 RepID=A0A6A8DBH0_9BACI|nr:SDR family oxidoreductase [Aquibacillus halophilus]MRH42650.1 SDR family oxidoreductase [Aquibacillus halophilus]
MGKNCLITGASGEIGSAIAERLASEGYTLILHYNINRENIERLILRLPKESVLDVVQGDLTSSSGIKLFLSNIHYSVDHVVFAGGKSEYGLFQDVTEDTMDEMLTLHVKATWLITKQLIPDMIKKNKGSIVVISSIWGDVGASCEVVYSSVKGAQNSFVKALAKELALSGISVNGVSPGFIDTKMNKLFTEADKKQIIDQIPMNRAGRPEEVAHTVSFLLDEKSSYIHGEIITISGAW